MQFKVLCFNVWCIPEWLRKVIPLPHRSITADNRHRLSLVLEIASNAGCDILALTELWDQSDREWLLTFAQKYGYDYNINPTISSRLPRFIGLSGPGLVVLSKHPLTLTSLYTYRFNGKPYRLDHGDWLPGKGVVVCEVQIADKKCNLALTHTVASYGDRPVAPHLPGRLKDEYYYQRLLQIKELVGELNKLSTDVPLIVVGDLNLEPQSTGLRFLKQSIGLSDAWTDTEEKGFTAIAPPNNKRVDYVLYRGNLSSPSCQMMMHGSATKLISDHLGVVASFNFDDKSQSSVNDAEISTLFADELHQGKRFQRYQIVHQLVRITTAGAMLLIISNPILFVLITLCGLLDIVYCERFMFPMYLELK
jgi:endonuclease/exonuclease/phosphatase family metal-dependent hydrolase